MRYDKRILHFEGIELGPSKLLVQSILIWKMMEWQREENVTILHHMEKLGCWFDEESQPS